MRLSKFLSLAVAMSRNQAKFFIRKGRLSVDGDVISDPYFEVDDASHVTFDGRSISIAEFQYILLHKPASYGCTTKDAQYPSVLKLLKNRSEDHYYYFANVLAPEVTGLVLLSDDARWTSRTKRRLLTKPHVYQIRSRDLISEDRLRQLKDAWLASSENRVGPPPETEQHDQKTLLLKTGNVGYQEILKVFSSVEIAIEAPHLIQLGRLKIGDLEAGEYLVLTEDGIKI